MDVDDAGVGMGGGDVYGHMKMEADDEIITGSPGHSSSRTSGSEELEIIGSSRPRKRPAASGEPECIDLTHEDENDESEDEDMVSEFGIDEEDDEIEEIKVADSDLPELIEVEPVPKREIAEDRRRMGNDHFKKGEYTQALQMYTKAIELVPSEASYYGNRAACFMMLKKYQEAFGDTRISLQLDENYDKGYLRLVRSTLALGDVLACSNAIALVEKKGGLKLDLTEEKRKLGLLQQFLNEMESSSRKKDFRKIVYLSERALDIAVGDCKLKIAKAEALMQLCRFIEAGDVCTEVLQIDNHSVEAICIRAVCLYQSDNLEKAIQFLKQGLTFAPDNNRCLGLYRKIKQIKDQRESAASLYKSTKMNEAKAIYTDCINAVKSGDMKNITIESKLAFNLALIAQKQSDLDESISQCNRAIELNPGYYKAFIHRANVHNAKEMHEEAVRDFEAAFKLDPTQRGLKNEIHNAKQSAKRAKRKDYYKILHVDKTASDDEIRKAYKRRAMLHHPDRHATSAEGIQKEQEKQFKDVGEAYEVLSDPKKRNRYDQGHDLNDTCSGGGGGGSYYDPYEANQIFNMFFSGGGVPTQRGGGSSRYHQFGRPAGGGGGGTYGYHR